MKKLTVCLGILISLAASAAVVDPVTVVDAGGKNILANTDHLTIYTYDKDNGSVSTCYNGCAHAWPPVLVADGDEVDAPLGLTKRTDGTQQLTVAGKPVYLYSGDSKEGDTNGDGLGGIWHVVPASVINP